MKTWIKSIALVLAMIPTFMRANEGMWLVSLLSKMQEAEMKNIGLNLTAKEIYDINNASLKDAIVRLNYGSCTGEVVSNQGLIFTNHHCAYDGIQTLSTVANNILVNGFMAKNLKEELPIPDFKISFLVRIEDVTKEMLDGLSESMSEADRDKAIADKTKAMREKYGESGKYDVDVKSFFYGNEFYVMVYETFSDIRLVGNPPESVGKFGGDTDNWMWPRHTGDFSMIRIYANKENKPAAYSTENVPYKPKHFLPVNINGIEEGDYAMIMGFPGRTSRYLTSWGINQAVNTRNPALIECLGKKLETWDTHMDADPAIDLMYAAKHASTANGWKYYIGQTRGLKRLDVQGEKAQIEARFTKWVNSSEDNKKKYSEALPLIEQYYKEWDPSVKASTYSSLAGVGGAEFLYFVVEMQGAIDQALTETDETKRAEALKGLQPSIDAFFKEYNAATDKDVFINLTNLYRQRITENRPTWMADLDKKYKGDAKAYADKLFATSVFVDKARLEKFLLKPTKKAMDKDIAVITATSAYQHAMAFRPLNPMAKFNKGYRLLVAGLQEMDKNKDYAPDANSTMRITYGQVLPYKGADALNYDYVTTSKGILEKWDNSNPEFVVPDKLVELIKKKDFGRYANKEGELNVCFLSNLDITGGNSGSPTIDGNGNLIGIAFDGNWEAMSGDIAFEPELQRTISVDIRYVLFIVEKLMGGENIINELKFAEKVERKPNAQPVIEPAAVPASSEAPTRVRGNDNATGLKISSGDKQQVKEDSARARAAAKEPKQAVKLQEAQKK